MYSALVWDCYAEMSSVSTSNSLAANKHHATTSLLNLLLKYRVWFAKSNVFKASKLPGRLWKVNWVSGACAERHFQKQKAAPVSAQHLMRVSGDVVPFALKGDMFSHLMKNLYWYSVSARAITYCGKTGWGRWGMREREVCSFHWGELFLGRHSSVFGNIPMSSLSPVGLRDFQQNYKFVVTARTIWDPSPPRRKILTQFLAFSLWYCLSGELRTQSRYTTDLLERASYAFPVEVQKQDNSLFDRFLLHFEQCPELQSGRERQFTKSLCFHGLNPRPPLFTWQLISKNCGGPLNDKLSMPWQPDNHVSCGKQTEDLRFLLERKSALKDC